MRLRKFREAFYTDAGVAESVDATDLNMNLNARRETGEVELLKFGENSGHAGGNP